ncbi:hypothetical protein [Planococcus sp. 107-1]|uniref:hypothetical protein n=1 Tax=Planococcus sp. 107-1 TaxID=2908840 RepID=UPI001F2FBE89|nr:hypothetical protein [Planococcus sp. 107-1]UJF27546.1 hypothetical protein L0M13_03470 [Planococcus sp. 107-1]
MNRIRSLLSLFNKKLSEGASMGWAKQEDRRSSWLLAGAVPLSDRSGLMASSY